MMLHIHFHLKFAKYNERNYKRDEIIRNIQQRHNNKIKKNANHTQMNVNIIM